MYVCVSVCVCEPVGEKKEQAGRGIVTFVHLSFRLSGAVITATGGSLLCLGLGPESQEHCQWENTVGEFGKMQGPWRNCFALSPH